jgi:hypothetical protein
LVDFKKCSPLKLLGQINQNLVEGSMEGPFINEWELNTFQGCFLPNFDSFGQAVTEGKIL